MDRRPPDTNVVKAWIARVILRLMGWRIAGQLPNLPKFVVVAGPHTSNWDGFLLFLVAGALRANLRWMGKSSLFRGPLSILFGGLLSGIPIDRSSAHNVVDQITAAFEQYERLALVLTPEATRKKMPYWRTGFYYITMQANVPIVYASADYTQKLIVIGEPYQPTGDIEATFAYARQFFDGVQAKYPDNVSDVRPRPRPADGPEGDAK